MLIKINPPTSDESRTKRKTRITILSTAFNLFAQNGFFSTSVVDISKSAKVTRRTFYNYYSTKEDVIRELHPIVMESLFSLVENRWQSEGSNNSDIRNYLTVFYRTIAEDQSIVKYLVKFDRFSNTRNDLIDEEHLLDRYIDEHTRIRSILTNIFSRTGGDTSSLGGDILIRVYIQSLLAFLSRFTYRIDSYRQEGVLDSDQFDTFLNCILKNTEGRVYA